MTERLYAGLRAAERDSRRRTLLLAAGLDQFATVGWAGSSVQGICRAAGLSPRYFYDHFDTRETLFLAVTEQIAREVEETVLAALTTADDPLARAGAVIEALDHYFASDPRTIRVALMESLSTAQFRDQRRALLATFSALGARLMRPLRQADARGRASRRRLELSAAVLTGGVVEALIAWEGEPSADRPLVGHLTDLYAAAAQV